MTSLTQASRSMEGQEVKVCQTVITEDMQRTFPTIHHSPPFRIDCLLAVPQPLSEAVGVGAQAGEGSGGKVREGVVEAKGREFRDSGS